MNNEAIAALRDSNRMLQHSMDDNVNLFRQAMALMNELQEAKERLEEAEKLLREWQQFVYEAMQLSMISSYHYVKKAELDERTDRFLKKEGKSE